MQPERSPKILRTCLDKRLTSDYCSLPGKYAWSKTIGIDGPRRGRGPNRHELGLYLFLDPQKQAHERDKLVRKFAQCKSDLEADPALRKKGTFYEQYYVLVRDGDGVVTHVENNTDAQRDKMKECGFFGYLGPPGFAPERVLELTKNRDYIEKDYEGKIFTC